MIKAKYTKKVYDDYKKHQHDTLSIAAIKKGKVQISYDDKDSFLTPHSLAIFNPYENHKTTVIDDDTSDYHILYFDLPWCLRIQGNEIFTPINQSIIEDDFLTKTFFSLCDRQDEKKAHLFISRLFKEYCSEESSGENMHEVLENVKNIIKTSDYETLSLEYLSKKAKISQNHLIRIFKKEFGLSPHAYILNHKVHKAKHLLEQGYSIAEASVSAGFYDQSHFHKAFKSIFAVTPKEFQKS